MMHHQKGGLRQIYQACFLYNIGHREGIETMQTKSREGGEPSRKDIEVLRPTSAHEDLPTIFRAENTLSSVGHLDTGMTGNREAFSAGFYQGLSSVADALKNCQALSSVADALKNCQGLSSAADALKNCQGLSVADALKNCQGLSVADALKNCQALSVADALKNCQALSGADALKNCQALSVADALKNCQALSGADALKNCQALSVADALKNCQALSVADALKNCQALSVADALKKVKDIDTKTLSIEVELPPGLTEFPRRRLRVLDDATVGELADHLAEV